MILNNLVRLLRPLFVFLLIFNVWVVDTNAATDSEKANEQIVFSKAKKGIVNKSKAILRFGPGKDRKICCRISDKGTSLKVLGKKDDWYQIKLGGTIAWIEARYLNIIEPEVSKDIVAAAGQVQVIKTLDNQKKEIQDKIEQKAALELADLENENPKGDADSTIIEEDILDEKNIINKADSIEIYTGPGKGFLNKDKVTLRFGPGLDRKICCRITDQGTTIRVLGKKDNWYQVKVGGTVAWIEAEHLTLGEKTIATAVIVDKVEEKELIKEREVSTHSEIEPQIELDTAKKGDLKPVISTKTEPPVVGIETFPKEIKGFVNRSKVVLRRGPGNNEKICCRISDKGTKVKALGKKGEWYKIKFGSAVAWIKGSYLTLGIPPVARVEKPEPVVPVSIAEEKDEKITAIEEKKQESEAVKVDMKIPEKEKTVEVASVDIGKKGPEIVSEEIVQVNEKQIPVKEEVLDKTPVIKPIKEVNPELKQKEVLKETVKIKEPLIVYTVNKDTVKKETYDDVIYTGPKAGIVNKEKAILRFGPGKDRKLCCRISGKGKLLKILGKKGDWYQIKLGGTIAWIEAANLTIGEQVIAAIDKPELITKTKVEEKEVLIAIEDKQEFTEKKEPVEEEVVIKELTVETVPMEEKDEITIKEEVPVDVSEMKADEPVKEEKKEMIAVIEKKEVLEKPQAIIEETVTEEIVKKERAAPEPTVITKRDDIEIFDKPAKGYLNKSMAILRYSPEKDGNLCCRISEKGTRVKILGKKGAWFQVKFGSAVAWIEEAYLNTDIIYAREVKEVESVTIEKKETIVDTKKEEILDEPEKVIEEVIEKEGPLVVAEVKKEEPLLIEKKEPILDEVEKPEVTEYEISTPVITTIKKSDDIEIFSEPGKGFVNKSKVNLRYSPDKNGKFCCRISEKGTRVKVLGKKSDWYKVKLGSAVAWIHGAYLTVGAMEVAKTISTEKVITESEVVVSEETSGKEIPFESAEAVKEEKAEPLFEEKEEAEIDEKVVISEEAKPEDIPDLAALEEKIDEDIESVEIVEEDIVEGGKEQVEDVEKVETVEEDEKETVEAILENREEEPVDKGTIEEEINKAQEDDELVFVKKIEISGNRMIDTGTLEKKVEVYLNKAITFEEMSEIPDAITVAYQEKGYILARAYLPEQEIQDGILKLSVAEGKIGKITVAGRTHYKDRVIKRFFKEQMKHGIVNENILEKGLLLTKQEVQKVKTDVVLKQGEEPGEVDIVLNTEDISALTLGMDLGIEYNNFGKDNVSKDRYTTNIKIIDHMWGSTTDFKTTMGNIPEDSTLVSVNFSAPINSYGTKYILNYVEGNYALGGALAELGLAGDSIIWNTEISHQFITRKNMNLTLSLGYGHKYSQMEIEDSGGLSIDEIDTFSIILNFDNLDRFLGKNIVNLSYFYGDVDPDNKIAPSRINYTHTFDKLSVYFARIQKLYGYTSLVTSISGQFTADRLLPMEQLSIGGFGTVRGHEPSLYSGDLGYNFAMELMFAPPYIAEKTIFGNRVAQILQFVLFYEYAEIFNSDHESDEYGSEDLSGYGLGVRFFYKELLTVKYDLGIPVNRKETYPKLIHYLQMTYNFF